MKTDFKTFFFQRYHTWTNLSIVTGFLVLVTLLGWFMVAQLDKQSRDTTAKALQTVLHTTQNALHIWVKDQIIEVERWAGNQVLVHLVKEQITLPQKREEFLHSPALAEMREFFRDAFTPQHFNGFFIITRDQINIGSMMDASVGTKNLIADQREDLLKAVFNGRTVLVPPIFSDVPLADERTKKRSLIPATMFIAAPVKDKNGTILAVLAARIAPELDFSQLAQSGRVGATGETYFFGKQGRLLTESRFEGDLQRAGVLKAGQSSVLLVEIRDPGGNLTEGFRPETPRNKLPLTFMARSAINGMAGQSTSSYNNYLGVPVLGAWLWDEKLDLGICTEINSGEALAPTAQSRIILVWIIGITALFAIAMYQSLIMLRNNGEEKLRQSEEKVRFILEHTGEAIYGIDLDGNCTFANSACIRMLGYDEPADVIGQDIHSLIHYKYSDGSLYPGNECTICFAFQKGLPTHVDEEVFWRADGSCFQAEYTSYPVFKKDTIVGAVVAFNDISPRKKSEEESRRLHNKLELRFKERTSELSKINHQFSMILDKTSQGFCQLDSQAVITEVNPSMAEILGIKKEAILGCPIIDFVAEEDKGITRQQIRRRNEGHSGNYEISFLRPNNSKRFCIIKATPLFDDTGHYSGSFAMVTDITGRVRAEHELYEAKTSAERANRAKSVFLASMSHELRTPMNSIIGFSQLLASDDNDSLSVQQKDHLQKILHSGEHLLQLINKVLDLAKIESGNLEISTKPVDVHAAVHESLEIVRHIAESKNIEVQTPELNKSLFIAADHSRFRDIILNLLSNAINYNRPGGRVRLSYESVNTNCRLIVSDTGPGIADEKIDLIFEPFNRLGAETSNIEGTGIGLTITKRLVDLMRGTIEVKSEVGIGTTVVVDLPMAAPATEQEDDSHRQNKQENTQIKGTYTLLYIEDNVINRELLEAILERNPNLQLLCAENAQEGIDIAISQKPDIILMDINLPDLNGFEALSRLREFQETQDTPVIAISGNVLPVDIEKARRAGFAEYLQKPYNISELYRIMSSILEG